jgi:hypothetical protein
VTHAVQVLDQAFDAAVHVGRRRRLDQRRDRRQLGKAERATRAAESLSHAAGRVDRARVGGREAVAQGSKLVDPASQRLEIPGAQTLTLDDAQAGPPP